MIVPLLLIAGAGFGGLIAWGRKRKKKAKMLGKVPPEPITPGSFVAFRRGPYLIFVEKADSPPDIEPPFTWGVASWDLVKEAAGKTEAEKILNAAKADASVAIIAHGAQTYAEAIELSQEWTQGLLGNAPAEPASGEFVVFGRGKGALTIFVGKVPAGNLPTSGKFQWAVLSSAAIAETLSAEDVMKDGPVVAGGVADTYKDAVKAAEEKIAGMQAIWVHLPPLGLPGPIVFKKKKSRWS